MSEEPAVGVDVSAQQRLWQIRESVAEVLGLYGPPLKFDVSLPLSAIAGFASESAELVAKHAPDAIPVLGYLDDAIMIPLGVALASRLIPREIMAEHRLTAAQKFPAGRPRFWRGCLIVTAIWLVLTALVVFMVIGLIRHVGPAIK